MSEEKKIYKNLEEAQEALNNGETVCIEAGNWIIDPRLLRLARHLQDKERLEEWKKGNIDKQA